MHEQTIAALTATSSLICIDTFKGAKYVLVFSFHLLRNRKTKAFHCSSNKKNENVLSVRRFYFVTIQSHIKVLEFKSQMSKRHHVMNFRIFLIFAKL